MNGLFITGSDTHVGKTYISQQIITELVKRGFNVIPRKPVESGCEKIDGELYPADADKLLKASRSNQSLAEVCPYRFEAAISPQLAARQANTPLQLEQLVSVCTDGITKDDFLIVEGAGGFYSPICEGALNVDLARQLQLPVILVVEDRLGSVNQGLLTIEAIKSSELALAAIILNRVSGDAIDSSIDNLHELSAFSDLPVIQVGHNSHIADKQLYQIFPTGQ